MNREVCTEVYDILNFLGDSYKKQIPITILNSIKRNVDISYLKKLSKIDLSEKNELYKENTLAMIAFLNLKYCCKNKKMSKELRKMYQENDKK